MGWARAHGQRGAGALARGGARQARRGEADAGFGRARRLARRARTRMSAEEAFQALRPAKRKAPPPAPRIFDQTDASVASDALKMRLDGLRVKYANADATTLLRAMIKDEFAGKITTVSSFGSESVVLLHLISQIDP